MTTRRLEDNLGADVFGFSALRGKDEQGTLERIKSLPGEVTKERRGRIFTVTGDGAGR